MKKTNSRGGAGLGETRLQQIAGSFSYPATPDVTRSVASGMQAQRNLRPWRPQRLAWVAVLVILFLLSLLAVPEVRAAIQRIFQIGAITIFEMADPAGEVESTAVETGDLPLVTTEFTRVVSLAEAIELLPEGLDLPGAGSGLGVPDQILLYQEAGWPQTAIVMEEDMGNRADGRPCLFVVIIPLAPGLLEQSNVADNDLV